MKKVLLIIIFFGIVSNIYSEKLYIENNGNKIYLGMDFYELESFMGSPKQDYELENSFDSFFRRAVWDSLEIVYYIDSNSGKSTVFEILVIGTNFVDNLGGFVGRDIDEFKDNLPQCDYREYRNILLVKYYFTYIIEKDIYEYTDDEIHLIETEFQLTESERFNEWGKIKYSIEENLITSIRIYRAGEI